MPSKDPAPGQLELVQDFINSYEFNIGREDREDFADLVALRRWLSTRGLIARGDRLEEGDLGRAIAVREALRAVLATGEPDASKLRELNGAAAAAPLRVQFASDGTPSLTPAAGGLDKALAQLFASIECAASEGTLARLKICAADDCRWAFYDHTRNRSGAWCTMESCGNRAKVRAYRQRHRHAD